MDDNEQDVARPNDGSEPLGDLGNCLRASFTAVIVGEEDYATPVAMAEQLHQSIAGSTLTVLPKARHLTPLEVPDIIAAELKRLLARAR